MANHILTIDMTKFIGAEIMKQENPDGYEEEGIFIPFHKNNVRRGKKGTAFCQFYIVQKKNNFYFNQTHYVTPKYTKSFMKEIQELGYSRPYVGHVTPCWDKDLNKLTRETQARAFKGYVKVDSMQKEDGDE